MSVRTDVINLNVNINGNNAQNNLNELRKKAADIKFEMEGLKKGTQDYITKSSELKQVNAQMSELKKTIGITALSQKELTQELSKLKSLRGSVVPFSNEYKELNKQIKQTESRLYDVRNGVTGFASTLSKVKDSVKQFGLVAAGYLGFQFITSQFQNMIRGAGKLSDSLADIQRVTGLTAAETTNLNNKLKEFDTRTSTEGLRNIVTIAGKLGVAKDDLIGFTKAVDQLVVSLGDELGDADQITEQLGKILNVFDGKVSGENITKLGNAFVELANTGAATGGFIADFDQRLSGIAKSAGISLGALSGLGAGLEELGGRVESSSTAIQKLIISIAQDIPAAAKIAGMDTKAFNELFAKDATEALLKYSEGLVKNKASFSAVTASFKDAGEEGARTIETISKLGSSADYLRGRINLGKKSIEETTAITGAYELQNQTLGATIDKLGKEFNRIITSSAMISFLNGLIDAASGFLNTLKQIPGWIDRNSTALQLMLVGIILLKQSYILSSLAIINDTVARIANAVATKAIAVANGIAIGSQAAYITITNLLAGRIAFATAMQRLWNIATAAGAFPLGALVIGAGALMIALGSLIGRNKELTAAQKANAEVQQKVADSTTEQLGKFDILKRVVMDNTVALDNRKKALNELIALNPSYLNGLTLENIKTAEGSRLLDGYVKNLMRKAEAEAKNAVYTEKLTAKQRAFASIRSNPSFAGWDDAKMERWFKDADKEGKKSWFSGDTKFQGINITETVEAMKQVEVLGADLTKSAKQNVENILNTTSTTVAAATTATAKTAVKKVKQVESELEKLKKEWKKFVKDLEEAMVYTPDDPLSKGLAKITEEYDEQLAALNNFLKKKIISQQEYSERSAAIEMLRLRKIKDLLTKLNVDPSAAMQMGGNLAKAPTGGNSVGFGGRDWSKDISRVNDDNLAAAELAMIRSRGKKKLQAELQYLELRMNLDLANTELTENQRELIEEEFRQKSKEATAAHFLAIAEAIIDTAQQLHAIATDVFQAINNAEQNQFNKEKKLNEAKAANFKRQLDGKLMSQAQYDKKIDALNAEQDKKKHDLDVKAFKRQQKLAIIGALINGAMAVVSTLAARPGLADIFTLGVARAIQVGLVVAATGAQIAAIATQKPPEAAEGHWFRNGKKHKEGGIKVEIERDEAVMKADAMTNPEVLTVTGTTSQITSALNSRKGGVNWSGGARVVDMPAWRTNRPAQLNPNMARIMEQGGVARALPGTSQGDNESTELLRKNNQLLENQIEEMRNWKSKIKGEWVIKDLDETRAKYDQAKKVSGL